ncbi:Malyl-CoA lyase [Delftia tsuruhatensis]|nr:Malyl-CoA lyase [Delftia tsuruhatensis]CAC9689004.1 Malyl-CoA lyase [Delftia tsuruhatensis]
MTFRPRSLLYIPATATRFMARAAQRGADAIVLDLEDAVAPAHKAQARALLAPAIAGLKKACPVLVRINADEALWREDTGAALSAGCDGLVIPKVESAADVQRVAALAEARGARALHLQAIVETPRALLHLGEIAHASPRLTSLAFGGEDFATALDVAPLPCALSMPAQAVAIAAVAAGLHPMGLAGTIGGYGDLEAFEALARLSRALGMRGAACIHPAQLPVLHLAFGASEEQLQQAREIVRAHEHAQARGQGAVAVAGHMVDAPIAERARRLLRDAGEQA